MRGYSIPADSDRSIFQYHPSRLDREAHAFGQGIVSPLSNWARTAGMPSEHQRDALSYAFPRDGARITLGRQQIHQRAGARSRRPASQPRHAGPNENGQAFERALRIASCQCADVVWHVATRSGHRRFHGGESGIANPTGFERQTNRPGSGWLDITLRIADPESLSQIARKIVPIDKVNSGGLHLLSYDGPAAC